ncbi:MAG: DUF454 family protein [Pseudorhodoplanes sp.]|nr:YbaN family protein [Pseudorhodoplanes sp.]MCL4713078.1 DUF454 family protein [Pseudorhodoplanes sp.]MCQ3943750.1 DUF454 domain-containing protein [Alphaproteobacteria bacterium]
MPPAASRAASGAARRPGLIGRLPALSSRVLWFSLGLTSVACGIAGIILPLVPTTPFLLLAAFAFARSSPRLHAWLVSHPRLGPPINDWQRHRAIRRRAKVVAVAAMVAFLTLGAALGLAPEIIAAQALVFAAVAAFVLTRPGVPEADE